MAVTARRTGLLEELAGETPGIRYARHMDLRDPARAVSILDGLIEEMGGVDLVVVSAGTGFLNPELDWDKEERTIEVNVTGFAALAGAAMKYFLERGEGHLVGISSIAALRGGREAPAYNASKAFESNYLEALRSKARRERGGGITVTEIMPGLVDTAMAKGENLIWVAPVEKAARQILRAIERRRKRAYVTKRWRLVAWFFRI